MGQRIIAMFGFLLVLVVAVLPAGIIAGLAGLGLYFLTGAVILVVPALAAEAVDAIDVSYEMIEAAEPHPTVCYHVVAAEHIPFREKHFDLATVALGFHWFDQDGFLAETARVLKPGAWLVIYTNWFSGEMAE